MVVCSFFWELHVKKKSYELVVRKLWALRVDHEPPGSSTNSRGTDVSTNSHVPEEQPTWDQALISLSWWLWIRRRKFILHHIVVKLSPSELKYDSASAGYNEYGSYFIHDVHVRGVEAKSSSWETVSDQVDPQKLYRNKRLRETQSSSQEDGDDLTNVWRNEVSNKLFHIVVNGTALLNGGNNAAEVIISQHHLSSRLGDSGSGSHSNTNFSLNQANKLVLVREKQNNPCFTICNIIKPSSRQEHHWHRHQSWQRLHKKKINGYYINV